MTGSVLCQGLRETGKLCRSGQKAKPHDVFGDDGIYRGLWVRVYLCPRCAKEFGVREKKPNASVRGGAAAPYPARSVGQESTGKES